LLGALFGVGRERIEHGAGVNELADRPRNEQLPQRHAEAARPVVEQRGFERKARARGL
jgi:hypothetical protein